MESQAVATAPPWEAMTSLGPIWVWGTDTGRPIILLITGLGAEQDLWALRYGLREFDYLRIHLPGEHSPPLADQSPAGIAAAVSELINERWSNRPILLAGFSVGALVALSVRAPAVRRLFLVEPPLLTGPLWPVEHWGDLPNAQSARELLWQSLGVAADRREPRDYMHLLDGLAVPADILLGEVPLEPKRELDALPSFVGEDVRAQLIQHPRVRTLSVSGVGHNVPGRAAEPLLSLLLERARSSLL